MDLAPFDKRKYRVVGARTGYADWADHYDATVAGGLDRPLLDGLTAVDFDGIEAAADLACGTGRTGVWLFERGVRQIDGVDFSQEMLQLAQSKGVYRSLRCADVAETNLPSSSYQLCTLVLADEHLAELAAVYQEAARLLRPRGYFTLIGYHPFFLMNGMPTHYHRPDGTPLSIESYVHLFSEHYHAGNRARLRLIEFQEQVIDEHWLLAKPKWREYLHWPVSFGLVWRYS